MEVFSYEVPLGSIGNIKTGDKIEQGIIKEIYSVGLDTNTMVVTGICEKMVDYSEENVKKACGSLVKGIEEFMNEEFPEDHPLRKMFDGKSPSR